MKILDGKWLAKQYRGWIKQKSEQLLDKTGVKPGLGVILVGGDPASKTYVASKEKAALNCGFNTFDARLPADAGYDDIAAAINHFNNDPAVHGILLQLPLPGGLDSDSLLDLISPDKDADGLHPYNQGLLQKGSGWVRPCTPQGSLRLIDLAFSDITPEKGLEVNPDEIEEADLSGLNAIVVGRSVLVGKPLATMLLERNATVTVAHSRTKNLEALVNSADIVVAAVGRPGLIKGSWISPGSIVVDVGINRLEDGSLGGDVCFQGLTARAITPVPGGVGPMTVTMLMLNTLMACERSTQK